MISLNEAQKIAESELRKMEIGGAPSMTILAEKTIEREFGWIFFYNSTEYLKNRNPSFMLAGNGPLIVERENGTLHHTGTAEPLDSYIQRIFKGG